MKQKSEETAARISSSIEQHLHQPRGIAPRCINVNLYGLGGKIIDFVADPSSTVKDLKVRIAEHLNIAPLCQCLIVGSTMMLDSECLSSQHNHDDVRHDQSQYFDASTNANVDITLILSTNEVFTRASNNKVAIRRATVETVAHVSHLDPDRAVEMLDVYCSDLDQKVRFAALRALAQVVPCNNDFVFTTLCKHLDHEDPFDRSEALEALFKALQRRDQRTSAEVTSLEERCPLIVTMFMRLVASAQSSHDVGAYRHGIAALCVCLENSNENVRSAAVNAFAKVVPLGDTFANAEVLKSIGRTRGFAKQTALGVLTHIALKDDPLTIDALCKCLEDWDERVRSAAAKALRCLVMKAGDVILEAIAARLENSYKPTRRIVVELLTAVVTQDNLQNAIGIVGRRLEHLDIGVRHCAAEVLSKMTRRGTDAPLLDIAISHIDHPNELVRRSAAKLVAGLTKHGRERPATASTLTCNSTRPLNIQIQPTPDKSQEGVRGESNSIALSKLNVLTKTSSWHGQQKQHQQPRQQVQKERQWSQAQQPHYGMPSKASRFLPRSTVPPPVPSSRPQCCLGVKKRSPPSSTPNCPATPKGLGDSRGTEPPAKVAPRLCASLSTAAGLALSSPPVKITQMVSTQSSTSAPLDLPQDVGPLRLAILRGFGRHAQEVPTRPSHR